MAEEPKVDPNTERALALFNELWTDTSEAGRLLRQRAKEKYPDAKLPEEAAEPAIAPLRAQLEEIQATLKEEREQRAKEREDEQNRRQEVDLESRLNAARTRYNLTDEGFDKMVARIKETGNYNDIEATAAWVVQQTPAPAPAGPYLGPQNINLFGTSDPNPQFELLHRDPAGRFLDEEFRQFTTDPDKYVRDAGFA